MPDVTDPAPIPPESPSPDDNHEPAAAEGEPAEPAAEEPGDGDPDAALRAAQEAAIAEGRVFARPECDYHAGLAKLIPKLSEVRSRIAQRRENYQKGRRHGAPKWGQWLEGDFRAQTGVTLSAKTIKKYIDESEKKVRAPRVRKPAVTINASTAKGLGLTSLAVVELLEKANEQGTVVLTPEDVAALRGMLPRAEEVTRLVSSLPDPGQGAASVKVSAVGSAAQAVPGTPTDPHPEPSTVKAGDVGGLAAAFVQKCAPELDAVLGNATLHGVAAAVRSLAEVVRQKFHKPGCGRIVVQVRAIPAKPQIPREPSPATEPSFWDAPGAAIGSRFVA